MKSKSAYRKAGSPNAQGGVVLLVALIILIAMTIAGIALLRSVDTTNIIAGNLAFKQSATHSGDIGVERAIAWLESNRDGAFLHGNPTGANFYSPNGNDPSRSPAPGQSWDAYWEILQTQAGRGVWTLPDSDTDFNNSGNRIRLIIDRMCRTAGPPLGADCVDSTVDLKSTDGCDLEDPTCRQRATYYRITMRIEGPRNTRSYVQAMVTI